MLGFPHMIEGSTQKIISFLLGVLCQEAIPQEERNYSKDNIEKRGSEVFDSTETAYRDIHAAMVKACDLFQVAHDGEAREN